MINWGQVDLLRNEIGPDALSEVIELFLEEMSAEIEALTQESEPAQLEVRYHALKGSALNLGFAEFSELCSSAESAAAEGDADACGISTVVAVYDASRNAFLSGLTTRA